MKCCLRYNDTPFDTKWPDALFTTRRSVEVRGCQSGRMVLVETEDRRVPATLRRMWVDSEWIQQESGNG